jgi:hypothetical protein
VSARRAGSNLVHAWQVPDGWRGAGTHQPYVDRALTAAEAVIDGARAADPALAGISWEAEVPVFAAGAMLALVALELVPHGFTARTWRSGLAGAAAGAVAMLALSAAIGV